MAGYDKFGLPNVVTQGNGDPIIADIKAKISSQETKTLSDGRKETFYYDKDGKLLITKMTSNNNKSSVFQIPVKTESTNALWTLTDDDGDGNIDFMNYQNFSEGYSEWYRSSEDNGWFDMYGRDEAQGSKLKSAGKAAGGKAGASGIDTKC